jgi:hypothetical protein
MAIGIMQIVQQIDTGIRKPHFQPCAFFAAPIVYIAILDPILPVPSIIPVTVLVTFLARPLDLPISAEQTEEIVLFTPCRKIPKNKK